MTRYFALGNPGPPYLALVRFADDGPERLSPRTPTWTPCPTAVRILAGDNLDADELNEDAAATLARSWAGSLEAKGEPAGHPFRGNQYEVHREDGSVEHYRPAGAGQAVRVADATGRQIGQAAPTPTQTTGTGRESRGSVIGRGGTPVTTASLGRGERAALGMGNPYDRVYSFTNGQTGAQTYEVHRQDGTIEKFSKDQTMGGRIIKGDLAAMTPAERETAQMGALSPREAQTYATVMRNTGGTGSVTHDEALNAVFASPNPAAYGFIRGAGANHADAIDATRNLSLDAELRGYSAAVQLGYDHQTAQTYAQLDPTARTGFDNLVKAGLSPSDAAIGAKGGIGTDTRSTNNFQQLLQSGMDVHEAVQVASLSRGDWQTYTSLRAGGLSHGDSIKLAQDAGRMATYQAVRTAGGDQIQGMEAANLSAMGRAEYGKQLAAGADHATALAAGLAAVPAVPDLSDHAAVRQALTDFVSRPEVAAFLANDANFTSAMEGAMSYHDPSASVRGDPALAAIYAARGFDAKPTVVSEAQLLTMIQSDPTRMLDLWRGVSMTGAVAAYQSGEHFAGYGVHGNGTYTANDNTRAGPNGGGPHTASSYAGSGGERMHLTVDPNAAFANESELRQALIGIAGVRAPVPGRGGLNGPTLGLTGDPKIDDRIERVFGLTRQPASLGRAAAALGYDGIAATNGGRTPMGYYVVLNRGVVTISSKVHPRR